MKSLLFFLGPLLTLLPTCNPAESYFVFDRVDYYHLPQTDQRVSYYVEGGSAADSLRYEVIEGNVPQSLSDSGFVASLPAMDYVSKGIAARHLPVLREIFGPDPPRDTVSFGAFCTPVYRDILVFRWSGRITGVAKICFHCWKAYILTGGIVKDYFGSYNALRDVLWPG